MRVLRVFVFLFFFGTIACAKDFRQEARGRRKSRAETLENLFNVYDPTFLSYVWPKIRNGVHLTTSRPCWDDLSLFFRDLAEGHAWAYRTADACGRYGAGALAGRSFWLGDRGQCLLLDANHSPPSANNTWGEFYSGDYVSALLRRESEGPMDSWSLAEHEALVRRLSEQDNTSPVPLSYVVLKVAINITKFAIAKSHDITLGLCVPRSCGADDILALVNFSLTLDTLRANTSVPRQLRVTALRHVQGAYHLGADVGAVVLILITALLVTSSVIATIVDLEVIKFTKKSVSFDVEQYEGRKPEKKVRVAKDLRDLDLQLKPPSVTLDVANVEGIIGSCSRCGKYKRQCPMSKPNLAVPAKPTVPCPRVKYNSCASLATDYKQHVGAFKSLLLSFSLKHSWLKLFNTSMANKDLSVVHGLKIVATLWIIFVHVAVLVSSLSDTAHTFEEPNNVYFIVLTGTLAFDTLFFASGLFSGHHFFYLKSRYSVEELVTFGGACGQALQLLCFITNRAIRLLPSYAYVLFLTAVLSRVTRDTAALAPPEPDARACADHWWRNVLYITNAYPNEEQCMQVSWYLSLETQLHVCGALLCLLLTSPRRRVAAALAVALVVSAAVYDLTDSYTDFNQRVTESFSAYALFINRPWSRVAPYFVGVLAAWILHQLEGTLNICKTTSYSLWFASGLSLATGAGLAAAAAAPWLSAWPHLLWPLGLLWPAVVCATQYAASTRRLLEHGWAAGLSRACYGALLLHGVAARAPLLATDSALCSSTLCIWWYFAGTILLTLVAAACLCLLVEMPICSLLRRISDYSYR
ncbi:O-acyltransferase like protein-like [Aricia agestis]|uniref:O-acyltransferase like protein-like n=1 Tax=Aricia agestis TaxID=91739 RepID=UPI001C203039|nr:O-acyltransferase like protein-like [Aricia agestis]